MSSRFKERKKIIQYLYNIELTNSSVDEVLEAHNDENTSDYIKNTLNGVVNNIEILDEVISKNLTNWKLERLNIIDVVIFRLATYEMKFNDEIPVPVAINEAIELSKIFSDNGDNKSVSFNNKVLDNISKSI